MKMDTLSWTRLNQTVKLKTTNKKFFNQYLFKVKLHCPFAGILRGDVYKNFHDLVDTINQRKKILESLRKYNWAGSWFNSDVNYSKSVVLNDLQSVNLFKQKYQDAINVRIEEPFLSVYSNSNDILLELCSRFTADRILEIYFPKNNTEEEILHTGSLISNKGTEYQYRLDVKTFLFDSVTTKQKILFQLENLGDTVDISRATRKKFLSGNSYFLGGGRIYIKDENTLTYLKLMCPQIIGRIYNLSAPDLLNK